MMSWDENVLFLQF